MACRAEWKVAHKEATLQAAQLRQLGQPGRHSTTTAQVAAYWNAQLAVDNPNHITTDALKQWAKEGRRMYGTVWGTFCTVCRCMVASVQ